MNDPIAYGPTGIRCGCGKDAHSNLTPCQPEITSLSAAVAAEGALPVPVGDQPQALDEKRLAEIAARATSEHLTPGPWRLERESCDCGDGYGCRHGDYVTGVVTPTPTEIALDRCKRTGEQPRDYDFHRSDIGDFTDADWELMAHARTDVPALLAEVQRLKAELVSAREDNAFLQRNTLPELRRTAQHHQDGKKRWRDRAEKAEARVAELEAERHTTNEALSDAAEQLRADRDALTQRDAQVLRNAAEALEDNGHNDAATLLYLLANPTNTATEAVS